MLNCLRKLLWFWRGNQSGDVVSTPRLGREHGEDPTLPRHAKPGKLKQEALLRENVDDLLTPFTGPGYKTAAQQLWDEAANTDAEPEPDPGEETVDYIDPGDPYEVLVYPFVGIARRAEVPHVLYRHGGFKGADGMIEEDDPNFLGYCTPIPTVTENDKMRFDHTIRSFVWPNMSVPADGTRRPTVTDIQRGDAIPVVHTHIGIRAKRSCLLRKDNCDD